VARDVVLAVDSSTTSTKVLAFAGDGTRLAAARGSHDRRSPRPGHQEQDPAEWWDRLSVALAEVAEQCRAADLTPRAISITHQRETFALLDGDGKAVRPAVLWLDTRAGEQIATLGSDDVHARSGKPPSTTPSLYKIAWLAQHEPEALRRAERVVDVHGYLVERLIGRSVTSWASADPLSMLDMTTFTWDEGLLELAGLRRDQVQELAAPGSVMGGLTAEVAGLTGLPEGLPVVAGCGDGQAAGLGAGATRTGVVYLNLGTGFTMGTHAETYSTSRAYRTLGSPLAGAWTLEALLSSGALSLSWVADLVGASGPAELEPEAAAAPVGAGGLLYLPYLTSAETPHWDALVRGAFVGLTDGHSRGNLYRAVVEGLAMEEALSITAVEGAVGAPVDEVRCLGGASASSLMTGVLVDVLQRPVLVCDEPEATAMGAAILAAGAVGLDGFASPAEAAQSMTHVRPTRDPDPVAGERYRELTEIYGEVYPSTRDISHRLQAFRA
jgi:xylulokinase